MPKIQNLDGSIFDTETGELTLPEKPVEVAPSEAPMLDEPSSAMDKILQFSYGFNRSLFEMTDPIVEGIAKMTGIKDPVKIGDFVQVFNRGETAPKNRTERYARTLGDYTALTGSASGLLAFMARKGFLGRAEKTGKLSKSVTYDDKLVLSAPTTLDKALDTRFTRGFSPYYISNTLKGASKDMLDYVRKNPREALFIDLAFTGSLAATEQSIEEFMDEGTAKELAKGLNPIFQMAIGVPAIALGEALFKISPTRFAGQLLKGERGEEELAKKSLADILKEDPRYIESIGQKSLPVPGLDKMVDFANNKSLKSAGEKLDAIFTILRDPVYKEGQSFQFAKRLKEWEEENKELFEGIGFNLNIAELADSATLNKMIEAYSATVPQPVLKDLIEVQNQKLTNLATLFTRMTPQEQKDNGAFLRLYYESLKKNAEELNEKAGKIGEKDAKAFERKYSYGTLDDIGMFFEKAILQKLDQVDKNFQLRAEQGQFTRTRDGADAPTRDPSKFSQEELRGEAIPGIPSMEFTDFLIKFKRKFVPTERDERDFQDVSLTRIYNLVDNFFAARQNEFIRRIEEGFKTNTNKDGEYLGVPGFREFMLSKNSYKVGKKEVELPVLYAISRRYKDKKGKLQLIKGESIAPELQMLIRGLDTPEQQMNTVFNHAFFNFYKNTNFKAIKNPRDKETGKLVKEKDRNILYYPTQNQIDSLIKNYIKKNDYTEKDLLPKITLTLPDAFSLLGKVRNSLANTQSQVNKEFKDFNTGRRFLLSQQTMFDDLNKEILRGFKKQGLGKFVKEYQDTFSFFKNTLAKKTLDPGTSAESLAKFLLRDSANLKELNKLFEKSNGKHVSSYITYLEKAVIGQATGNNPENVFMKNGEFDFEAFSNAIRNKIAPNIRKNLPQELKDRLSKADLMATRILTRRKAMEDKANAITEGSFMLGIKNYVAEGQNYGDVILKALKEPQFMTVLKKEADRAEAEAISKAKKGLTPDGISKKFAASQEARDKLINPLRSQVWKFYKEQFGFGKDIYDVPNKLQMFITNPKIRSSLEQIYSKKELDNLDKLAELERRILSAGRTEADLSRGATTINQKFQELFGFGIQTLESSSRAAFITNKQAPISMFFGLGARLIGRQQMNVYDAAMFTAATNPKIAEKIVNSLDDYQSPEGLAQARELLGNVGSYYKNVLDDMTGIRPRAVMATKVALPIEVSEQLQGEEDKVPLPDIQKPQAMPPMSTVIKPSAQPQQRAPDFATRYEALFPDDSIVPLLKRNQPPQR